MKKVKVLIIGQGFMGGIAHPRAILEANQQLRPRGIELLLSGIAGRDAQRLGETQVRYGFERAATDWKAEAYPPLVMNAVRQLLAVSPDLHTC